MKCRVFPIELRLKREFVVAGGRESLKRNFIFIIENTGLGEAAGSVHYGVSAKEIEDDLHKAARYLSGFDIEDCPDAVDSMDGMLCAPARCAISTAWHDWRARKRNVPLHEDMMLGKPEAKPTSVTVSVGDAESMTEHIEAGYRHIKIKMGGDCEINRGLIKAMNESRDALFRIDANGSWTLEDAQSVISTLNPDRVELIEQPFSPGAFDDWMRLRECSSIPLFMDESIVDAADVKRVAGYVDGVNIKIQKSGRLETALEAIRTARELGLRTMLGCMIESSVGIAAAWHLSSLADYLDLDGRLLIETDPFTGLTYGDGTIEISRDSGHGVRFAR